MRLNGWRLLTLVVLLGSAVTASAGRILILGDSLSSAHNMLPAEGWVSLLDARLQAEAPGQHQVINASISGESSSGGLARLPALLRQHRPDVVVIELGGNDALQGRPASLIRSNFERMIGLAQAASARVALLGVIVPEPFTRIDTATQARFYADVSAWGRVPLAPSAMAGISGEPSLLQRDGLHPNAVAQPLVLANAWPAIAAALASPAQQPEVPAHPRWQHPRPH